MKVNKTMIKKAVSLLFYIISIYYFYIVIKGINFDDFSEISNTRTYFVTFMLAIFHSILLVLVAYMYSFNLISFSNMKINIKNSTKASTQYLLANVAKYVPGNVVHYVGRNALLSEIGYYHKQIAFTSFFELILMAITSLSIAMLTSFDFLLQQLQLYLDLEQIIIIISVLLILGLLSMTVIIWYIKKYKPDLVAQYKEFVTKKLVIRFILTFLFYAIYFVLLSTSLLFVLYIIFGLKFSFVISLKIIGLFIVAYFIGMVAPGVPGGIGVREAVAIALISQYVEEDVLFIAVILLRLITILGDIISFMYGKCLDYCMKRREI